MLDALDRVRINSPGRVLQKDKSQIIELWIKRINQEINYPSRVNHFSLVGQTSQLVDCIADALLAHSIDGVKEKCHQLASILGGERACVSDYAPNELIKEYSILCEVICDLLDTKAHLNLDEFKIIYGVTSMALQDSIMAYNEVRSEFKEKFIATLAHDLRCPIGVAKTAIELIIHDRHNPDEAHFLSQRALANLRRADDLIQSLLDVAYKHAGLELNYTMEACDLKNIITEVIQGLTMTYGNRFIFHSEAIEGHWNKSAIRRSIENLLTNALKYGTLNQSILIECSRKTENVEIKVHNEGRPIPEIEQINIFQPFRREKGILESSPGWGLGLSFVQSATEAHHGHVKVSSSPEKGTDFIIELPIDSRHKRDCERRTQVTPR